MKGCIQENSMELTNTFQEKAIRGFGAEICKVVKLWRPAQAKRRCLLCGKKFYHIMAHVAKCKGFEDVFIERHCLLVQLELEMEAVINDDGTD
jgi:hypothetical protein